MDGVIIAVHFLCVCIKILSIEYKVTVYIYLCTRRLFDFICLFNVIRTKICIITHHTPSIAVIFWKVKYKEHAIALKKKVGDYELIRVFFAASLFSEHCNTFETIHLKLFVTYNT